MKEYKKEKGSKKESVEKKDRGKGKRRKVLFVKLGVM